jgi:predicted ATPase/serine/threonine protein kinase
MFSAGEKLGRYRICSHLGAGGMGEVFLAEDERLRRRVALKILPGEFHQDARRAARFLREAQAASALNHPNICTIYEVNDERSETPFIAMEYVEGETLDRKIRSRELNVWRALELALQIADALAEAHAHNIVHRDIKPSNLIVNTRGLVKVLDFGLAKKIALQGEDVTQQALSHEGMIVGTLAYMSPEQARGVAVDARTDVFSFGVVLYEMLTGRMPFTGETTSDVLAAILTKEPPSPVAFNPEIPAALERIVLKAMAKQRAARYPSAKELLADLKSLSNWFEQNVQQQVTEQIEKQSETQILSGAASAKTERADPPNNLSKQTAPQRLIGREKEIAAVVAILKQPEICLVTMTGIGGTGKTRLSKAVAHELLHEFTDGVFFVELDAIADAQLVAAVIAQALGVKETSGKTILENLQDFLRDKQMLLVLDNFEQLTDAAPQIADLLDAAERLKILITSRVVLRLSREREFVVPPLAAPSEISQISLADLGQFEAVRLFVERARQAKPNFVLTEENSQSVAQICVRLDGLPLAIELAAARVKILSPGQILTKLENSLRLLTGGSRDLPARQQTMRAAIEWSYQILGENEKRLFRLLSVFAGGFTFEAAESVVVQANLESDGQPAIEVLDDITSLIEQSLLVSKEQPDGTIRFRMLEVVREFASEFLEKCGESEIVNRSHAEYFLQLAEEAEPRLQSEDSAVWLDRLEEEHDNLRAALRWSLERDCAVAARVAASLRSFWTFHTHLTEGRTFLKAALEKCPENLSSVRFKMLTGLAILSRYHGDHETARKSYEEGLATGKAAGDLRQVALASRGLGLTIYGQGDTAAARKFIEEGLKISRELNDQTGIAYSLNILGDWARTEEDYAAALPLFEESLAIFKQLGLSQAVTETANNLAAAAYGSGNFAVARAHFAEALTMAQKLRDKISVSSSLDGFAALAAEAGDIERAASLAGAAERLRESIGYENEPAERRFREAYLEKTRADVSEDAFAAAYEKGRLMQPEEVVSLAFGEFFKTDERKGKTETVRDEMVTAFKTEGDGDSIGAKTSNIMVADKAEDASRTAMMPRLAVTALENAVITKSEEQKLPAKTNLGERWSWLLIALISALILTAGAFFAYQFL